MKRVITEGLEEEEVEKYYLLVLHASGDDWGGEDADKYGLDQLCKEEIGLCEVKDKEARWFDVWSYVYSYDTENDRRVASDMLEDTFIKFSDATGPHHTIHLYNMTRKEFLLCSNNKNIYK